MATLPNALPSTTVVSLFARQVAARPEKIGLVFGDTTFTYSEMSRRVTRLAKRLRQRGVRRGDVVAVVMPRSPDAIISYLAVLEIGACYLPADVDYPQSRLHSMLEHARPSCVLTDNDPSGVVGGVAQTLSLDQLKLSLLCEDDEGAAAWADDVVDASLREDDAAYLMYTSGSTGRPKGVIVTHAGIVRLVSRPDYVCLDSDQVILQLAPLAFDASTFEIWAALLNGGTLVLYPHRVPSLEGIGAELKTRGVTTLWLTASVFHAFVIDHLDDLGGIQQLLAGGDVLHPAAVRKVLDRFPQCRLINGYGPTECTTFTCCHTIDRDAAQGDSVPIGRPINETRVQVLDARLRSVPVGVVGELYASGTGVARGYLHHPALTAARFVADPNGSPGERMYRTGDLVRWRGDAALDFIGRVDAQVKIRGFRVEPGEIESALRRCTGVREAVVDVQILNDEKRLVAYVVPTPQLSVAQTRPALAIAQWRELYDATYRGSSSGSGDFNIVGWQSSYSGQAIPDDEMRIWVDQTVAALRSVGARDVLEIGCGTGLLLSQLAPSCRSYIGLDFSAEVLGQLRDYVRSRPDLEHVQLCHSAADQLSAFADDSADLIILNSVVQYFPDVSYLLDVLKHAFRVVRSGGSVFVGDVRSLPLLEPFHVSVQLHQLPGTTSLAQLRERVAHQVRTENELVVDPKLFFELSQRIPRAGRAQLRLKHGAYDNELSKFRYDVFIRVGTPETSRAAGECVAADPRGEWRVAVRRLLAESPTSVITVRGLRDVRAAAALEATRLCRSDMHTVRSVAQLRSACTACDGEHPDSIDEFASELGVAYEWLPSEVAGHYDLVFNPQWDSAAAPTIDDTGLALYANMPAHRTWEAEFSQSVLTELRQTVPDYMVPAACVILDALPMLPTGKVDRKALPRFQFTSSATYTPANSNIERILCSLTAKLLRVDQIGIDDNFFELGGDSIGSIQLVSAARSAGVDITPRDVFKHQTIRRLAAAAQTHLPLTSQPELDGARLGELPAFPVLQWVASRCSSLEAFTQSMLLLAPATLTIQDLIAALQAMLDGHDALRLKLGRESQQFDLTLEVPPPGAVSASTCVRRIDVDGNILPKVLQALVDEHASAAASRVSPITGRLVDVVWFAMGEQHRGRLLITIHHLAIDGVSWRVLIEDLVVAVSTAGRGLIPEPPKKGSSFRTWVLRLRQEAESPEREREASFWTEMLTRPVASLTDREPGSAPGDSIPSRVLKIALDSATTNALLTSASATLRARVNELMLAALALALARCTRRWPSMPPGILVNMEGHGREGLFGDVDVSRTIGWFTSVFPLRLDFATLNPESPSAGDSLLGRALRMVKTEFRRVPTGGLGFGLLRYLNSETKPLLAGLPHPDIGFNYLGRFASGATDWEVASEVDTSQANESRPGLLHPIDINAVVLDSALGPSLHASFRWAPEFVADGVVQALVNDWSHALRELAAEPGRHAIEALAPSDFPLVQLSQDEVDELSARHKNLEDVLPLTPLQEGLLFHAAYDAPDVYKVQWQFAVDGDLDLVRLRRAAEALIHRHAPLRAGFDASLKRAVQVIDRQPRLFWAAADLSNLDSAERDVRLQRLLDSQYTDAIDLAYPSLLRFAIVTLGPRSHRLVMTNPHILLDGWSMPILVRELLTLYETDGSAHALPIVTPYRDYFLARAKHDREAALRAWRAHLDAIEGPTRVRPLSVGPAVSSPHRVVLDLSSESTEHVRASAKTLGVTLSTLVQGAWAVLLARLTSQDDVVFGVTVSGRTAQVHGIETMIGLFINTVPLRVRVTAWRRAADMLQAIQRDHSELIPYQDVPLIDILQAIRFRELFDTLVVFENFPVDPGALDASHLLVRLAGERDAAHYPLTLVIIPEPHLRVRLDYRADLFDHGEAELIAQRFAHLLEEIAHSPQAPVAQLEALLPEERTRILHEWNDTRRTADLPVLPTLFEQRVARDPDAVAIHCGGEQLSYRQLNEQANHVAHALMESGIGAEDCVALASPRSIGMVAATLGILKAGAIYLPLDVNYPTERLRFMIRDSGAVAIVTTKQLSDLSIPGCKVLLLDDGNTAKQLAAQPTTNPSRVRLFPHNGAYIVYTSGSSGSPKGVLGSHLGMANRLAWFAATMPDLGGAPVLSKSSVSFLDGFTELMGPLLAGGSVIIADDRAAKNPLECARLIEQHGVGRITVVPSLLATFLAEVDSRRLVSCRQWVCSGERLPQSYATQFQQLLPLSRLFNFYGVSEASGDSVAVEYKDGKVLLGTPIWNTHVYLLDDNLRLVPSGIAGELYIGGIGLARAYWRQPTWTAAKFVANPHAGDGSRMYRTGDLAKWTRDGQLELVGRADYQVKIRGFRVELGEIETALRAHGDVDQAVVTSHGEGILIRLVGYITGAHGRTLDITSIDRELRAKLPDHMVPTLLMPLERMPLLPSGKVDRNQLPPPEFSRASPRNRPARLAEEEVLCTLFRDVLEVRNVDADSDFFALGGHSLLAVRLINRIRAAFNVELPIHALFEQPTIAGIARRVREAEASRYSPLVVQPLPERVHASYAQRRLWFIDQFDNAQSASYNMSEAWLIRGELDVAALSAAAQHIESRHEALRTRFEDVEGEPMQVIYDRGPMVIPTEDLRESSPEEKAVRVRATLRHEADAPFDLSTGPPWRLRLLRIADGEHLLTRTVHHIVSDGWSHGIINRDLATRYRAFHLGDKPASPVPQVRYRDFSEWQQAPHNRLVIEQGLVYWANTLEGVPERLTLPNDNQSADVDTTFAGVHTTSVTAELLERLKRLGNNARATLYMTLLAAYAALLAKYSGQDDLVVGTPIANRPDPQLDNVVGFFVNLLPMRIRIRPAATVADLLREVRETTLGAYQHQDVPFEQIVERISASRARDRMPLVQNVFALQNAPYEPLTLTGLEVEALPVGSLQPRFELQVHAAETSDNLTLTWHYDRKTYATWRIEQMSRHYVRLLSAFADAPEQPVQGMSLLDPSEEQALLDISRHVAPASSAVSVHELFEQQVGRTPSAIAVSDASSALTYHELDRRSDDLARRLASHCCGPESVVGICLHRSNRMVVAVLGVLKAGASFLPLDPALPQQRLAMIVADARPQLVIADSDTDDATSEWAVERFVLEDETDSSAVDLRSDAGSNPIRSSVAAYIMYTSGSTGQPRGVVVEHRQVLSYLKALTEQLQFGDQCSHLLCQPLAVDSSVTLLFSSLCFGGTLFLMPEDAALNANEWADYAERCGVDSLKIAPSHWKALTTSEDLRQFVPRTHLIFGGEPIDVQSVVDVQRASPQCAIFNHYGPTETTVGVFVYRLPLDLHLATATVPVGSPLSHVRSYVLDTQLRVVPKGVAGELYIGGAPVARGYLRQAAVTAQRFIADPFGPPGTRMYRTGDLARWSGDEQLEFLGRRDHQLKIRGFRVELGEVEAALREQSTVGEAVVDVLDDGARGKRLVAYVVAAHGSRVDVAQLRRSLVRRLPDYMIPVLVPLDRLPLSRHGKVDRLALPHPEQRPDTDVLPQTWPRNPNVEIMCGLFAEVLGHDRFGIDDNFFEAGGHSLLALRLASRIQDSLGVKLGVREIFEAPTVVALMERLRLPSSPEKMFDRILPLRASGRLPPLFCIHPAGGLAWSYAGLMRAIGRERPIYGLQDLAVHGSRRRAPATLDELANEYLRSIRLIQKHGPYHLLGASFGGLVAHALACKLHKAGESIDLLAIIDANPVNDRRKLPVPTRQQILQSIADEIDGNRERLGRGTVTVQSIIDAARSTGQMLGALEEKQLNRLVTRVQRHLKLSQTFRPSTFAGDALLVLCARGRPDQLHRRWQRCVGGTLARHDLDCRHHELFLARNMTIVGQVVMNYLSARSSDRG